MNKPNNMPPFPVIIFVIFLVAVFTDLSFFPLLIIAFVWFAIMNNRKRSMEQQRRRAMNPPQGPAQQGPSDGPLWTQQSGDAPPPLPTIDVPRYPQEGPGAPPPQQTWPSPQPSNQPASQGEPPLPGPPPLARPGSSPESSAPSPAPNPTPTPTSQTPAPQGPSNVSSDPAISLGQLHLARAGRDLQTALDGGSTEEVKRVLGEIEQVVQRVQQTLSVGSGREQRDFTQGLRRLTRTLGSAKNETPPGRHTSEVLRAATSLGQDGRYE